MIRTNLILASSLLTLGLTAAGTSMANAADLGGDCCADLEERIAELEATTVRKGNRKVSLTISGYIAQEITVWDDGQESNTYIHGLGPTQASHIKLGGQAIIAPGWTAGYLLRIQDLTGNAFSGGTAGVSQSTSTRNDNLNTQMSYWYVQSKELGKVSVGRLAHAAKSAGMFTDLSGTQIIDNYTFLDGFPNFRLRDVVRSACVSHLGTARLLLYAGRAARRRLQRHRHERRALRHADVRGLLGFRKLGRGRFLGAGRRAIRARSRASRSPPASATR